MFRWSCDPWGEVGLASDAVLWFPTIIHWDSQQQGSIKDLDGGKWVPCWGQLFKFRWGIQYVVTLVCCSSSVVLKDGADIWSLPVIWPNTYYTTIRSFMLNIPSTYAGTTTGPQRRLSLPSEEGHIFPHPTLTHVLAYLWPVCVHVHAESAQ